MDANGNADGPGITDDPAAVGDRVAIRRLEDAPGVGIDDRIERRHCEIWTPAPVDPEPVSPDSFRYPVDSAARITADRLTLEGFTRTFVHGAGSVTEVGHYESRTFDAGRYELELSGPVKLYVACEGPMRVEASVADLTVALEEPGPVRVGARSYHERPAATVTTTAAPADAMAAVSTLGSALKTTGSERSYPTLRGHPPAVELGDELAVPDGLEPPAADVRIEVPPTLRAVLTASPLAYYLGARVRPGTEPRVVADGDVVPLASDGNLEAGVERTLKKTFLLDCVVRTAGPRSTPLYERDALESSLDVDLGDLYGRKGADRLRAYATVP